MTRPTWWLLYGITALLVAMVGLVELLVAGDALRKVLEAVTVIAGFGLITRWRRNWIALDMGRRL